MSDQLAHGALVHWGLGAAKLTLIARRENTVYRVDTVKGARFALRLHRKGYQSKAALLSELAWMKHLSETGLSVPTAIPSRDGALLITLEGTYIDLVTWLDGVPLGETGTALEIDQPDLRFHELGAMMAELHNKSDSWERPPEFERPTWDLEGLLGENPLWGRFWENPELTSDEARILCSAREKAHEMLEHGDFDQGLIHADLVRENVLIDTGELHFIDFDDSGFGYRLFDVATALLKNRAEPNYPALEDALLTGYRSKRALDTAPLALFMALRAFTYLGWIVPRMHEPGAETRQARFKAEALYWAERV